MTPEFNIGDVVWCKNPTHPGENPFMIDDIYRMNRPYTYYSEKHNAFKCHNHGFSGCIESELELVRTDDCLIISAAYNLAVDIARVLEFADGNVRVNLCAEDAFRLRESSRSIIEKAEK